MLIELEFPGNMAGLPLYPTKGDINKDSAIPWLCHYCNGFGRKGRDSQAQTEAACHWPMSSCSFCRRLDLWLLKIESILRDNSNLSQRQWPRKVNAMGRNGCPWHQWWWWGYHNAAAASRFCPSWHIFYTFSENQKCKWITSTFKTISLYLLVFLNYGIYFRYLNTQYIKKQKFSDADINYGGFGVELNEQMLEIGEVNLHIFKKLARRI